MPDLRTLLHEAADAAPVAPAMLEVERDLARGRKALNRNRQLQWGVLPTGLAVAAAAGLVLAGPQLAPHPRPPVAVAPGAESGSGTSGTPGTPGGAETNLSAGIALVAFTGKQPAGYTIDKVPDGWKVQNVDDYSLVIAPVGTKDNDPNSFRGKILIGKANEGEIAVERPGPQKMIKVGDVQGRLFTFPDPEPAPGRPQVADDDKGTQGLLLPVGKDDYLIFQIPGTLKWDADTVADFAAGVHMNPNARAAAG